MRKMKKTDLDWIEQVPFDWDVKKLKYCFTFGKGLSITKEDLEESGIPVVSYGQIHSKQNTGTSVNDSLIRYVNESYLRTNMSALVKKNDFIFADTSEDLDGCGNCIYNDFDGNLFAGYHTIIFRSQQSNAKYFAYLFLTDCWRSQIRKVASGVKLYSITQKILKETSIIIPPLPEQKKIADFLDAKCADIDQIRADIEKQIEILTDYKKSIITEAVTKGLDPKAKMKDSGIEWIGKIPEHWMTIKVGFCFTFSSGDTLTSESIKEEGDYVVYGANGIRGYYSRSNLEGKHILIGRVGALCGNIHISNGMVWVTEHALIARKKRPLDEKFYGYVFEAMNLGQYSKASAQPVISSETLSSLKFVEPSLDEQKTISAFLDEKCSEIDATIAEKQKQLETLEEYKKSLIFEYVTGKKEVV